MIEVTIVFLLFVAVTVLVLLARQIAQPYPVLLVLGGLVLGFVPRLPTITMQPDLVFLVFLPPLLFVESINTSLRDFRANFRAIFLLSTGLVVATIFSVAWVAHRLIPNLPWSAAAVLGAVIAPTDAVATSAIASRLKLPRQIIDVLSGESLVNDATAIVALRIAIAATLGTAFTAGSVFGEFLKVSLGGIAIGLVTGWLVGEIRKRLPIDPPIENTVSLLTPYAAYLPAEYFHVSGVLSVVAAGLYLSRLGPRIVSAQTRLQAVSLWRMVTFLFNGILFLLVGLQLRHIVAGIEEFSLLNVTIKALLIGIAAILTRIVWVFMLTYSLRFIDKFVRRCPTDIPPVKEVTIIAWSGMRGAISLAAALSIPLTLGSGTAANSPFPQHNLLLFVTFVVILMTLTLQGLSLPMLIRGFRLGAGHDEMHEENDARATVIAAAMDELESASDRHKASDEVKESIRQLYNARRETIEVRHSAQHNSDSPDSNASQPTTATVYLRVKRDLLQTERATAIRLRDDATISDDILRRLQHDLDLEEARMASLLDD